MLRRSNKLPKPYKKGKKENVLVIGDVHEPFALEGYLEFCREQQEKYKCGTVVCIGDIIDNHFSSYHETELEADGANIEFEKTKERIARWYKVFPNMIITLGNHDMMPKRKSKSGGIANQWMKSFNEALGTPTWEWVYEVELYGVNYNHGNGGTAKTRMKNELQSQVQGHAHSQAYIEYAFGKIKIFGMQVGCGVDRHSYAMAYGKNGKKPAISCGVVLDSGTLPILIPMELK